MNDFKRFEKLIHNGTSCVSIVTHEERYALEVIRKAALELDRDMWIWSLAGGVYDGHVHGGAFIAETERPDAGMANLTQAKSGSLCVLLDMAEHLKAGKSLCAKAIASAWHQPLLRLDPGSLYASYIGQSEANLRDALKQTEMMAPVVLWIDEIEKAFASAASRSADGGLSQRLFGTLLTWLQEHEEPVFVVATANDIEALPPELLRKGRFDEIFFVDLPTHEVREEIFAIHLRKRGRDPQAFDLKALAVATEGFSGAEIEQGILSALHEAFAHKKELDTEQITKTMRLSPPLSVTMAEHVMATRQWALGRCVPADAHQEEA